MVSTVKARKHYGANSLNLTIPTELRKKYGLNIGDIYEVSVDEAETHIKVIFKRVYINNQNSLISGS